MSTGHRYLNEYDKSVACLKAQHAMGSELGLAHMQSRAALNSAELGVALTLHVRAARQALCW
jgi:hypothetical protein